MIVVVTVVGGFQELKEYWTTREEVLKAEEKEEPVMSIEECHRMLMRDFEMKMMPNVKEGTSVWKPVEHDFVDVDRWKWENYPILHSMDLHTQMK